MTWAQFLLEIEKKAQQKGIEQDNIVWAHLHIEGKGVIHIGLSEKPGKK